MQTIAIVNEKGGSGKTTTSVNLTAALGREGLKVLLVDLDGQAASTRWLGLEDDTRFADALWAGTGLEPIEAVLPGVDLAPGHGKLDSVAHDLRPTQGGQLRKLLSELDGRYDLAMIDCPPSLGNRLIGNALMAATHALVPVETSILAMDCMKSLLETIEDVREGLGHDIKLMGILPCRFDGRTNLSRSVVGELRRVLPGKVLNTVIRENVRLRECPASGMCIFDYAPGSNGAEDYQSLARELVAIRNGSWTPVSPDANWREVSELCKARSSSHAKPSANDPLQQDDPAPVQAETRSEDPSGESARVDQAAEAHATQAGLDETLAETAPVKDEPAPAQDKAIHVGNETTLDEDDSPSVQAEATLPQDHPAEPTADVPPGDEVPDAPQPEATTAPVELAGEPDDARDVAGVIEDAQASDLTQAGVIEDAETQADEVDEADGPAGESEDQAAVVPARPPLRPEQAKEALKNLTSRVPADDGPSLQPPSLDSTDADNHAPEAHTQTFAKQADANDDETDETDRVETETIDGAGQVVVTLDAQPAAPQAETADAPAPAPADDANLDDVVITIDESPPSWETPDSSTSQDEAPTSDAPSPCPTETPDADDDPSASSAVPLTWDEVVNPAGEADDDAQADAEAPVDAAQADQADPSANATGDAPEPAESMELDAAPGLDPAAPAMEWDPDETSPDPGLEQARQAEDPSPGEVASQDPPIPASLEPSIEPSMDSTTPEPERVGQAEGLGDASGEAGDVDDGLDPSSQADDAQGDEASPPPQSAPPAGTWPTPESEFYRPILEALATLGGTSKEDEVLGLVGETMPLNDADRAPAPDGGDMPVWKSTAQKAKRLLTIDGLMKEQRFRRIWKITSRGKSALNDSQHKRIYD
jgi:chromosome partitioning protein